MKKYNSFGNSATERPQFLCIIPLLTHRPLLFVIFASLNASYTENRGLTPTSVLYGNPTHHSLPQGLKPLT